MFKMMKLEKGNGLMGATFLHVQATMSAITLTSAFFTLETGYDFFLPEFCQIISLIEEVYCYRFFSSEKRLEYRFDGGFVPPLFLAATKCRDRGVRRRAIRLLRAAPMREGVFDSVCAHGVVVHYRNAPEQPIEASHCRSLGGSSGHLSEFHAAETVRRTSPQSKGSKPFLMQVGRRARM
jgi:hypothetical protein